MEKNLLLKEQQNLKELNNKKINFLDYELKIILNENNDGSMNLQFRLLEKPKSLLPHLEPSMNICYSSLDSRNIRNINEYNECQEKVFEIIKSWKEIDIDEIVSEADQYLKLESQYKDIVSLSINNDLKAGIHKFYFLEEKINNEIKILIYENKIKTLYEFKNKTLYNFEIVEMQGEEFINLGYVDYNRLQEIAFKKKKNKKTKRIILKINGLKAYSFFYFDNEKLYKILDNCRISSKYSRFGLNSVFNNKKIMIIGLGAIGSHVAELIASFWPSKIVLWDDDFNFANSSTRQNYLSYEEPFPKSTLLKIRLNKYKDVEIIEQISKFPEKKNTNLPKVDYIIDCTGEGIITKEFNQISNFTTNKTIIASAYILNKSFIKICDFNTLTNDGPIKKWHKYDIENNKKYGSKVVFRGCSQFIEYSYLDVYLISTHLVSSILKYKGKSYEFKEIDSLR